MNAFVNATRVACALLACAALAGGVRAQQTVGLFENDPGASDGFVLFSPNNHNVAYLINGDGHVVHSWTSSWPPGLACYLLPDGNLLRAAQVPHDPAFEGARGHGGRIEEYDWDGNLVWSYEMNTDRFLQHHDFMRMPNGNTLIMAWQYHDATEAIQAGRDPAHTTDGNIWSESIFEIAKTGPNDGEIVWEWHSWDHMVQDFDPTKDNYGVVADHPERIDINMNGNQDFLHFNGVDYDPVHDQIVISIREYSEFWILDHSTTTEEAAGHTGGTYGKGGDLLYRWGNPAAYDRGTSADRILYHQHDSHWIDAGDPGARNIVLFNNGTGARGAFSTVDEIVLPVDGNGVYEDPGSGPYGPAAPAWTYTGSPPTSFYAPIISGAHRLANGNTFVTEGTKGNLFEVTPAGERVWRYVNPVGLGGPLAQGEEPDVVGAGALENLVFKARRYAREYAAFDGRDLTPSGPLEGHQVPDAVPDGSAGTSPLTASRSTPAGDQIELSWDTTTCQAAFDYNLLYGRLGDVATYELLGSRCDLGVGGGYTWSSVPGEDLFFLVVGVDVTGLYESGWGVDGDGAERNGTAASFACGVTIKDPAGACP